MNMNTKYTISNFKNFDGKGATISLAPITILTGCNSSGKSSLVKSLVLLNDFLDKVKQDWEKNYAFDLTNKCLDFSTSHLQLGSYDLALNRNAAKNAPITFRFENVFAGETFITSLCFNKNKKDILNNGWCERFTIENQNGEVIADCRFNGERGFKFDALNMAVIKKHIINAISYLTHSFLLFEEKDWRNSEERSGIGFKVTEKWHKMLEPIISHLTVEEKHFYTNQILSELDKGNPFSFISSIDFTCSPEESKFGQLLMSFGNDIIFFTELNDLQGLNTEETIEALRKKANKTYSPTIIDKTEQIIQDFVKSDFDTFLSYCESKENEYLAKMHKNHKGFVEYSDWRPTSRPSISPYIKNLSVKDMDYVVPKGYSDTQSEINVFENALEIVRNNGGKIVYPHYYTEEEQNKLQQELTEKWRKSSLNFETLSKVILALYNKLPDFEYESAFTYKPIAEEFHFFDYVENFIESLIVPNTVGFLKYVPAEGVNVKRLYATNDSESSISRALVEYYQLAIYDESVGDFMNKWLQNLGIAQSIEFKRTDEGSGFVIFLNKTTSKKDRFLLADEGYGITQLVYILIQIEIAKAKRGFYKDNEEFSYTFNNNDIRPNPYTICVEEPESHLHPKLQSQLAELFLEAYEKYNIHFIIETHSEYLIRKVQLLAAKIDPLDDKTNIPVYYEKGVDSISIFYVNPKHIEQPVKRINICSDGYLDDSFGEGFYDEATRLSRRLMS